MNTEHPVEGQTVTVKVGDGAFQQATFRRGQFVDLYGLILDERKVSDWKPRDAMPPASNGIQASPP